MSSRYRVILYKSKIIFGQSKSVSRKLLLIVIIMETIFFPNALLLYYFSMNVKSNFGIFLT